MFPYSKSAVAMWLLGSNNNSNNNDRKDHDNQNHDDHNSTQQHHRKSKRHATSIPLIGKKSHHRQRRLTRRDDKLSSVQSQIQYNIRTTKSSPSMLSSSDETYSGIEVSLSHDHQNECTSSSVDNKQYNQHHQPLVSGSTKKPTSALVLSPLSTSSASPVSTSFISKRQYYQQQQQSYLFECMKIYRTQFHSTSTTTSSMMQEHNTTSKAIKQQQQQQYQKLFQNFHPRNHRVPIFTNPTTNTTTTTTNQNQLLYDDAMFLLRDNYHVMDELSCVKDEISLLQQEIENMQHDKNDILQLVSQHQQQQHDSDGHIDKTMNDINQNTTGTLNVPYPWDVHHHLLIRPSSSTSSLSLSSLSLKHSNNSSRPILLTQQQRNELQHQRGLNFMVSIQPPNTSSNNNSTSSNLLLEALMSKCGCNASILSQLFFTKSITSNDPVRKITYDACRDGGAGVTIQHLSLFNMAPTALSSSKVQQSSSSSNTPTSPSSWNSTTNNTAAIASIDQNHNNATRRRSPPLPSFVISRDNGKTYYYNDQLPDRLYQRIKSIQTKNKKHEQEQQQYYMDNIIYLSTGTLGSYFVEFRSGETWWGLPLDNSNIENQLEFATLCEDWDIHRVVFGPHTYIQTTNPPIPGTGSSANVHTTSTNSQQSSTKHTNPTNYIASSWIIIAKDGKVAWKNIPVRLHNMLSNRIASDTIPIEVSLGSSDSYFIRFLDGTTDWQLPAKTAKACQDLENDGKQILSISLHPDLSNDFIIRYR